MNSQSPATMVFSSVFLTRRGLYEATEELNDLLSYGWHLIDCRLQPIGLFKLRTVLIAFLEHDAMPGGCCRDDGCCEQEDVEEEEE